MDERARGKGVVSMTRGQKKRAAKAQERKELFTVAGTALGILAIWVWMAVLAVMA